MTNEETLKIFAVLKANYGNFFKSINSRDAQAMVNLWAEMFEDKSYGLVGTAVKSYIANDTSGYPPNVGQINAYINKLTQKDEMSEQEAINIITKACANSSYNSTEEFKKLPDILKKLVGSPSQLREWAIMDSEEFNTVVSSNLMRSYKAIKKRDIEIQNLPPSVKEVLHKLTGNFEMLN